MRSALQQGDADGLCGIYAILNFLRVTGGWESEKPDETLRYLLESCKELGWLTPHNLIHGFEDYQLKAVLDRHIDNFRMPFSTYFIGDVVQTKRYKNFYSAAEAVVARGGALIGHASRRKHWLLVTGYNNIPHVYDSAKEGGAAEPLALNQRSLALEWGLIALPSKRAVVVVDL